MIIAKMGLPFVLDLLDMTLILTNLFNWYLLPCKNRSFLASPGSSWAKLRALSRLAHSVKPAYSPIILWSPHPPLFFCSLPTYEWFSRTEPCCNLGTFCRFIFCKWVSPYKLYLRPFNHVLFSRIAKRKQDEKSFYGGLLHVCYAPEFETIEDTRAKLNERRRYILRTTGNRGMFMELVFLVNSFHFVTLQHSQK